MERIVRSSVKLAKRTASVKIVTAKHPGKRPTAGGDVGKHFCNCVLGLCKPLASATGLEVVVVGGLWFVQGLVAGRELFGI